MQEAASGLLLLFAHGRRPSREALLGAVAEFGRAFVSFDPGAVDKHGTVRHGHLRPGMDVRRGWLELLRDGLTFDLLGLDGVPGVNIPQARHVVGAIDVPDGARPEAIGLFPGPHLIDGAHSLPVVRTQLSLAADLVRHFEGCIALMWMPAATFVSAEIFSRLTKGWLSGGAFPGPALIGWIAEESGAGRTDGLDFFLGHELVLETHVDGDRLAAPKLAMRIVHELIGHPPDALPTTIDIAGWPRISLAIDGETRLIRAVVG